MGTTQTTKLKQYLSYALKAPGQVVDFTIPIKPVPCPRPRMTRWGETYYPKTYVSWRKEAQLYIPNLPAPLTGPVLVCVDSVLPPFKRATSECPMGDVDNYAKSILDAISVRGGVLENDRQVLVLLSLKRFTRDNEEPHTHVHIREVPPA